MRGGFYYDLSKRVYRKVKTLPVISLTASVSESVVEGVLSRTVMRQLDPTDAAGAVAVSGLGGRVIWRGMPWEVDRPQQKGAVWGCIDRPQQKGRGAHPLTMSCMYAYKISDIQPPPPPQQQ